MPGSGYVYAISFFVCLVSFHFLEMLRDELPVTSVGVTLPWAGWLQVSRGSGEWCVGSSVCVVWHHQGCLVARVGGGAGCRRIGALCVGKLLVGKRNDW